MEQLSSILRQAGLRLTTARQTVFRALQHTDIPLTASDIAQRCPHINRTSVYRIIDTFQRLGIIATIRVGWKPHYELAEPFLPHHHHLICQRCKHAAPLQDPELEALIHLIGTRHEFTITQHHFELEGICRQCRSQGV